MREATQRRLRVLAALVHNLGPNTEALHIALKIARVNLNARHVHLFRYCARPVVHEWAAVLQTDLLEWLEGLLDLPLQHPQALHTLQTPVMQGGLGFLNPQHEAALHFLQACLPNVEELPQREDADDIATRQLAETLDYLDHQAATPLRPGIAHVTPRRMGHRLRSAFYTARGRQLRDICPWLTPPGCLRQHRGCRTSHGSGRLRRRWRGTQPPRTISSRRSLCGMPFESTLASRSLRLARDVSIPRSPLVDGVTNH